MATEANLKQRFCHLMLSKLCIICRMLCRGQQPKPSPEFWHSPSNLRRARWMTDPANKPMTRTAPRHPLRYRKEGLCSETWMTVQAWGRLCGIWKPDAHRMFTFVSTVKSTGKLRYRQGIWMKYLICLWTSGNVTIRYW